MLRFRENRENLILPVATGLKSAFHGVLSGIFKQLMQISHILHVLLGPKSKGKDGFLQSSPSVNILMILAGNRVGR